MYRPRLILIRVHELWSTFIPTAELHLPAAESTGLTVGLVDDYIARRSWSVLLKVLRKRSKWSVVKVLDMVVRS